MPLVFSPLTESVISLPPTKLLPRHAFVMRQLGSPPPIDVEMLEVVARVFARRRIELVDASATTAGKDFLERILDLIRSTGFTLAIFSHETRQTALANVMMELGFAAMCGKPLVIVKSKQAGAPSDLTRTDWIEYDGIDRRGFARKIDQAVDVLENMHEFERTVLDVALEANCPDCAVALERCNKGFLLSGDKKFVTAARRILKTLDKVDEGAVLADLERLRMEVKTFIRQAAKAATIKTA